MTTIAHDIHRMNWSYGDRNLRGVIDAFLDSSIDDKSSRITDYGLAMTLLAVWQQIGIVTAACFLIWASLRICVAACRSCGACKDVPSCVLRPPSRFSLPVWLLALFVCVLLAATAMVVTHVVGHKSFFSALRDTHGAVKAIGDTVEDLATTANQAATVAPAIATSLAANIANATTLLETDVVDNLDALDNYADMLGSIDCGSVCTNAVGAMNDVSVSVRSGLAYARAGDLLTMATGARSVTLAELGTVADFASAMYKLLNTTQDIEDAADTMLDYADQYEYVHYAATLVWSTVSVAIAGGTLLLLWAASRNKSWRSRGARTTCTTLAVVVAIALCFAYNAYLLVSTFSADLCIETYARRDAALKTGTGVDESTGARLLRACATSEPVVNAFDILPWSTIVSALNPPAPTSAGSFAPQIALISACIDDEILADAPRAVCSEAIVNVTNTVSAMAASYDVALQMRSSMLQLAALADDVSSVTCGAVYTRAQSALSTACGRTLHTVFAAAMCSYAAAWILIAFTCFTAHVPREGCDPAVCILPGRGRPARNERAGFVPIVDGVAPAAPVASAALPAVPLRAIRVGGPATQDEEEDETNAPVRRADSSLNSDSEDP